MTVSDLTKHKEPPHGFYHRPTTGKPRQSVQAACLRLSRPGVLTPICCTPEAEQRLEDTQASPSQPTPILTQRQRAEAGRERQLVPLCSPDNFQSPGQLPEEQASGMGGTRRPEA